jgi:hypothetical protein
MMYASCAKIIAKTGGILRMALGTFIESKFTLMDSKLVGTGLANLFRK